MSCGLPRYTPVPTLVVVTDLSLHMLLLFRRGPDLSRAVVVRCRNHFYRPMGRGQRRNSRV